MKPGAIHRHFRQWVREAVGWLPLGRARLPSSSRIRRALPGLRDSVRRELDQSNHDLERTFLELGNQFLPLHAKVGALAASCDSLVNLAGGQREGRTLFQEAVDGLQQPLAYIDFCASRQNELIDYVQRCEQQTARMLGVQKQMRDMLAPLTYIEVLFKIESAVLDQEHRDTFLTVATEIARLRRLVDETFTANTELLSRTLAVLGDVRRRLTHDFQAHAEQVTARRRQIDRAIQALDEDLRRNQHEEDQLRAVSRELAGHIDALVAGVQRQDIVKQKCDHVVQALDGFDPRTVPAGPFLELQSHQIAAAELEITAAVDSTHQSFSAIEHDAAQVEQRCLALTRDEPAPDAASTDGAQALFEALASVHAIVRETLALAETSLEAARPAGNIATDLSTSLGDLSINMRLIALNAQVRSLQIGSGTGLEILAARTATLSGEIAETSRQVAEDLGQMQSVAGELFAIFDDFIARGRTEIARLAADQGSGTQRLQELKTQTRAVVAEVSATVHAVRDSTARARSTMTGAPAARAGLERARAQLARFGEVHRLTGAHALARQELAAFRDHARAYTMDSERRVHEAVVSGAPAQLRVEETGTGAVELFDPAPAQTELERKTVGHRLAFPSVPATVTPPPAPAPAPESRPATPPASPAATSAPPPATSSNFGDNVDLF